MKRRPGLWYPLAAVLAAVYWYSAAWLCFAVTGHDPLDALGGAGTAAQRLTIAALMSLAVAAFAWLDRRLRGRTLRG